MLAIVGELPDSLRKDLGSRLGDENSAPLADKPGGYAHISGNKRISANGSFQQGTSEPLRPAREAEHIGFPHKSGDVSRRKTTGKVNTGGLAPTERSKQRAVPRQHESDVVTPGCQQSSRTDDGIHALLGYHPT